MVATTKRLAAARNKVSGAGWPALVVAVLQAAIVLVLAQRTDVWPAALVAVLAVELWPLRPSGGLTRQTRGAFVLERVPRLLVGLSTVLIIAVAPRLATQAVAAVLYALWQVWWSGEGGTGRASLVNLLIVQAVVFEAVFLMAAIWRTPDWIVLACAWVSAYVSVYAVLVRRGERAAGVLAASWAVMTVEVGWVLLLWLFTYTMSGGYILVPQPALVLTALAYCFGSIYASQREGNLSRGRLAEYLVIGLVLVGIVVLGTSWHGGV